MSNGVDDIEGCLDFCADDFEFFGVLDALDEALMCFCYNSEAEYEQYGESDICVDGLGGEDDGICAMDVYDITTCPSPTMLPSPSPTLLPSPTPTPLPTTAEPTTAEPTTAKPTDAPIIP